MNNEKKENKKLFISPNTKGNSEGLKELVERMNKIKSATGRDVYTYFNEVLIDTEMGNNEEILKQYMEDFNNWDNHQHEIFVNQDMSLEDAASEILYRKISYDDGKEVYADYHGILIDTRSVMRPEEVIEKYMENIENNNFLENEINEQEPVIETKSIEEELGVESIKQEPIIEEKAMVEEEPIVEEKAMVEEEPIVEEKAIVEEEPVVEIEDIKEELSEEKENKESDQLTGSGLDQIESIAERQKSGKFSQFLNNLKNRLMGKSKDQNNDIQK